MKIGNLIKGTFQERPNRFTVIFEHKRCEEKAHLRDPGRLRELLLPGADLLLRPAQNNVKRKTKYDVIAVWSEGIWVLINSGFHSDLAQELLESGLISEFEGYKVEKREYTYGKSRLDFLLTGKEGTLLLEVKGCTLVEKGHAKFPDAPTERGKRHVEELTKARQQGLNAAVLFIIPREDAEIFSPNWEMDPPFSLALQHAQEEGVHIIAYSFRMIYKKDSLTLNPLKRIKLRVKGKTKGYKNKSED
jgi:sugar fermentation stimulation protein A